MNDDAPRAGNAIRPFRSINKAVEAKNSSEFITDVIALVYATFNSTCSGKTQYVTFTHSGHRVVLMTN